MIKLKNNEQIEKIECEEWEKWNLKDLYFFLMNLDSIIHKLDAIVEIQLMIGYGINTMPDYNKGVKLKEILVNIKKLYWFWYCNYENYLLTFEKIYNNSKWKRIIEDE